MATKTKAEQKAAAGSTSKCPVSREQFSEKADAVEIKIGESSLTAMPKHFKTKSLGWYANGSTAMRIDGKLVEVTIGITMTIKGSKELPGFVEPTDEE
jgi:hypothetical protein